MQISAHAFWLQKAGNQREEYEDAYSYSSDFASDGSSFLCAVADGATEASFSGLWANILVSAFVEKRLAEITPDNIRLLVSEWDKKIAEISSARPLSWYAEEKLRSGAFSSLLGLQIDPDGAWKAISVGDSCLFQIREGERIASSPFDSPQQFNNHPLLISTMTARNTNLTATTVEGEWQDGDRFLLMTDALAHCFLANENVTRRNFLRVTDQSFFEYIVTRLRGLKACKNDGVTLVRVRVNSQEQRGGMA
jgi:serine/threonine protein phosphatase PrpC